MPDQVMDAIHFADFVMAKEKKDRIGSTADTVYPMKFFLFHGQKDILGLMGAPFHHPTLDDKDVISLLVRMSALALDAKAVLHVMEAWMADRCAGCGAGVTETRDGHCGVCGAETVPPSKTPEYRVVVSPTIDPKRPTEDRLADLDTTEIRLPNMREYRPAPEALEWHRRKKLLIA